MRPLQGESSGSVRGGASGSIEPLNFDKKVKLNYYLIFRIWYTVRSFGTNRFLFEPLDSKSQ